jgi:hypothetical protein
MASVVISSPAKRGRCRRLTPTEGSRVLSMKVMTPPALRATSPSRNPRRGGNESRCNFYNLQNLQNLQNLPILQNLQNLQNLRNRR